MPVDALDARILRLLLQQPRTSVREYARILGVARGTLQARLDRMEREGVITAAGPRISPAALGHPVLAFVRIEVTQGHLDEIGAELAVVPEIIEAFSITGGGDLLARVVARDNAHLEDIIQRLIRLPGVVRTRTEIALRERVAERVLPLVETVERAAEQLRAAEPRLPERPEAGEADPHERDPGTETGQAAGPGADTDRGAEAGTPASAPAAPTPSPAPGTPAPPCPQGGWRGAASHPPAAQRAAR